MPYVWIYQINVDAAFIYVILNIRCLRLKELHGFFLWPKIDWHIETSASLMYNLLRNFCQKVQLMSKMQSAVENTSQFVSEGFIRNESELKNYWQRTSK